MNEDEFNRIVLESVDIGLSALGEMIALHVYFYSERKGVEKTRIPEELDTFSECLDEVFGMGAIVIEEMIADALHMRLGLPSVQKTGKRLQELVIQAREILENRSKQERQTAHPRIAGRAWAREER